MAQHAWLCGDTWCHTSYTSSFPSTQGPTVLPTIPDTVHAVHDTVHDTVHAVFWTVHGRSMPHHWEEGREGIPQPTRNGSKAPKRRPEGHGKSCEGQRRFKRGSRANSTWIKRKQTRYERRGEAEDNGSVGH
eukprot:scaffold285_cov330-Pavlova_lutheri.AAC.44